MIVQVDNFQALISGCIQWNEATWISCFRSFYTARPESVILCPISRSEKLKPFWLSIEDEDLSTLHSLSDMLLTRDPSPEYREAITHALDIPECKVVPFFGFFLRELKSIFVGVPSIVVLPSEENQSLEVSDELFC